MIKYWIAAVVMLGSYTSAMADEVAGHLDWLNRVELGTPISGRISRVAVAPGDRVKAGAVLVALDDRRYAAQWVASKAALEAARQDKLEADKELERTLDLFDRTVLSEHDRNLAEIAAAQATADWRQAQADLAAAQSDLDDCRVKAPFSGIVVKVAAISGMTTINQLQLQPLVVLADDSAFLAHGRVSAGQAAILTAGRALEVAANDTQYVGKVQHVGLEPASRSGEVWYMLTVQVERSGTSNLRAGEPVVIRF
ncbi:MAG: efflux RND transporter periplasmic adaptor subunit [Sedimenticola sp.]